MNRTLIGLMMGMMAAGLCAEPAHPPFEPLYPKGQGNVAGGLCFDPTEGLPRAVWTELLLDWMRTF